MTLRRRRVLMAPLKRITATAGNLQTRRDTLRVQPMHALLVDGRYASAVGFPDTALHCKLQHAAWHMARQGSTLQRSER